MIPWRSSKKRSRRYQSQSVPGVQLPRFVGGAVGYLSYEAVRAFEPRVGLAAGPGLGYPVAHFMLVDSLLVFDNVSRTIKVVAHLNLDLQPDVETAYAAATARIDELVAQLRKPMPVLPHGGEPVETSIEDRRRVNTDPLVYRKMVETAREYIAAGDIFQVVLSQRVDIPTPAHPFTIYRALRTINPSPVHVLSRHRRSLRCRRLAGTAGAGRGRHRYQSPDRRHAAARIRPKHDAELAEELLADEKERAEHIMLVDLGRNDVGRVSKPGTVRVPRLMEIERYSHVMHIVSNVEGEISDDFSPLDALRACFPAGTVSGAPKVRAMEIIAELEVDRRGAYAGAVGYVGFQRCDGHVHRAADAGLQGWRRLLAGGRRHRPRQHAGRRICGELPQDAGAGSGNRAGRVDREFGGSAMILLIDNYDSFTYNLYQFLAELGAEVHVVRNDMITVDEIRARRGEFDRIVISPDRARRPRRGFVSRSSSNLRERSRSSACASDTSR